MRKISRDKRFILKHEVISIMMSLVLIVCFALNVFAAYLSGEWVSENLFFYLFVFITIIVTIILNTFGLCLGIATVLRKKENKIIGSIGIIFNVFSILTIVYLFRNLDYITVIFHVIDMID